MTSQRLRETLLFLNEIQLVWTGSIPELSEFYANVCVKAAKNLWYFTLSPFNFTLK